MVANNPLLPIPRPRPRRTATADQPLQPREPSTPQPDALREAAWRVVAHWQFWDRPQAWLEPGGRLDRYITELEAILRQGEGQA